MTELPSVNQSMIVDFGGEDANFKSDETPIKGNILDDEKILEKKDDEKKLEKKDDEKIVDKQDEEKIVDKQEIKKQEL